MEATENEYDRENDRENVGGRATSTGDNSTTDEERIIERVREEDKKKGREKQNERKNKGETARKRTTKAHKQASEHENEEEEESDRYRATTTEDSDYERNEGERGDGKEDGRNGEPGTNDLQANHGEQEQNMIEEQLATPAQTVNYRLNDEVGDGLCSFHGVTTVLSLSAAEATNGYLDYNLSRRAFLQSAISDRSIILKSAELADFLTTYNPEDSTSENDRVTRAILILVNAFVDEMNDLEAASREFETFKDAGDWHTSNAAKGAEFFGDYVKHEMKERGHEVRVHQISFDRPVEGTSTITSDELRELIQLQPEKGRLDLRNPLISEALDQGRLILFLNLGSGDGGHWATATPTGLITTAVHDACHQEPPETNDPSMPSSQSPTTPRKRLFLSPPNQTQTTSGKKGKQAEGQNQGTWIVKGKKAKGKKSKKIAKGQQFIRFSLPGKRQFSPTKPSFVRTDPEKNRASKKKKSSPLGGSGHP